MTNPEFIRKLETNLSRALPGMQAQARMSPVNHRHYIDIRPDHRVACVLALIYKGVEGWTTVLIERQTIHPEDKHGGQLGFPGGQLEESDPDLSYCALREAQEEIGIDPSKVKIIGQLTELYVYVSNFLVYPFVGFVDTMPKLVPQPTEVKSILHVPLKIIKVPEIKKKTDISVRGRLLKDVPYYEVSGKILWGATAMMMSELETLLPDFNPI